MNCTTILRLWNLSQCYLRWLCTYFCFIFFLGMLWFGTFFELYFITDRWNADPFTLTDCKLAFLYYFFQHFSSALLVIMSVEKVCALYFPFKTKTICTVKIAKRVTLITFVIFFAYDFQFFFIFNKTFEGGQYYCMFS